MKLLTMFIFGLISAAVLVQGSKPKCYEVKVYRKSEESKISEEDGKPDGVLAKSSGDS